MLAGLGDPTNGAGDFIGSTEREVVAVNDRDVAIGLSQSDRLSVGVPLSRSGWPQRVVLNRESDSTIVQSSAIRTIPPSPTSDELAVSPETTARGPQSCSAQPEHTRRTIMRTYDRNAFMTPDAPSSAIALPLRSANITIAQHLTYNPAHRHPDHTGRPRPGVTDALLNAGVRAVSAVDVDQGHWAGQPDIRRLRDQPDMAATRAGRPDLLT
jgi:hypothetical protein